MDLLAQIQAAKAARLLTAMFVTIPDYVISSIEDGDVRSALEILKAKGGGAASNPDAVVLGVGGFCTLVTHAMLTPAERTVALQIFSIAAASLYAGKSILKETLDDEDAITALSKTQEASFLLTKKGGKKLSGDGLNQELAEIYDYLSKWDQFNMRAGGLTKGGTGDDDAAATGSADDLSQFIESVTN